MGLQNQLTRGLAAVLGGDEAAAQDVRQEALLRAWRSLPSGLHPAAQQAWLTRTARNLAIDELRQRRRHATTSLDEAVEIAVSSDAEPNAASEALQRLSAHERFVLLLSCYAGFANAEIGRLLDVSEEAARKRVARARTAFTAAYKMTQAEAEPLILLLTRDEDPAAYVRWLERAGARVRQVSSSSPRQLALADGLVVSGSTRDLHPALYGEKPRVGPDETHDVTADRCALGVLIAALALDLPVLGICLGHQLLNIATGGSLYQDVRAETETRESHEYGIHDVATLNDSLTRTLIGRRSRVCSEHHQAVKRVGRKLSIAAQSSDGVVEAVERTDRRFGVGVQWHPERDSDETGGQVAAAFLEVTRHAT